MNRTDLQRLAELRLREADHLLNAELYAGAYYLLGYSVECGLKACIAKQIRQYDFPDRRLINDSYTHNLETLLRLSGLREELRADPELDLNWTVVKDWSEQSRYELGISEVRARDLNDAINDAANGVLPWLRTRW